MSALMGRLGPELQHVEADVAAAVRRYHLRAQLGRLAAGVAVSLIGSLTAGGPGPLDWKTLLPLVAVAVWTQVAKQWPSVPWDLLRVRLGLPVPPPAVDGDTVLRGHSGYGTPMQAVEVAPNPDGTFPAAAVGNPPVAGAPPGLQITPEG